MDKIINAISGLVGELHKAGYLVSGLLLATIGIYSSIENGTNVAWKNIYIIVIAIGLTVFIGGAIAGLINLLRVKRSYYESVFSGDSSSIWNELANRYFSQNLLFHSHKLEIIMAANSLWGSLCPKRLHRLEPSERKKRFSELDTTNEIQKYQLKGSFWNASDDIVGRKWHGIVDLIKNGKNYKIEEIELKFLLLHPTHPQVDVIKKAQIGAAKKAQSGGDLEQAPDAARDAYEDIYASLYVLWILQKQFKKIQSPKISMRVSLLQDTNLMMNFSFYKIANFGLHVCYPYDNLVDSSPCTYISTTHIEKSALKNVSHNVDAFISGKKAHFSVPHIDLSKIEHNIEDGYSKFLYQLNNTKNLGISYRSRIKKLEDDLVTN